MADELAKKCTCGRSITGDCLGWHNLTNEEYERVRDEAERKVLSERNTKFLTE